MIETRENEHATGARLPSPRLLRRTRKRRGLATILVIAVALEGRRVCGFQSPTFVSQVRRPTTTCCGWKDPVSFDLRRSRIRLFDSETSEDVKARSILDSSLHDIDSNGIINGVNTTGKAGAGVEAPSCRPESVNGVAPQQQLSNGVAQVNGIEQDSVQEDDDDVPMPTVNGGYSHTAASRAKISAANKGKTPWNKGKARSEETRARIAAGVKARNRQRFLEKLQSMGVTEEEYNQQKKEERRKKDAERRARKTAKGGYRPTEETKQKISKILKEKWKNGEISERRKVDPSKVRRGFTHSEETRAKISESLKRRWAKDSAYRENMRQKAYSSNAKADVKKRISDSLKKKWQDPEFRAKMMDKIATRKRNMSGPHDEAHREKISEAMRKKWQDEEYRKKTLAAIQKRRKSTPAKTSTAPKRASGTRGVASTAANADGIQMAQPVKACTKKVRKVKKKRPAVVFNEDGSPIVKKRVVKKRKTVKKKKKTEPEMSSKQNKKGEPDGSINRLREERRDLYDLLYGDDPVGGSMAALIGDENLDTFDPYGLEDF